MMTSLFGLVLVGLSILLLRVTKKYELAGNRFFAAAARSTWMPILFTALFGLGVVAAAGGIVELVSM
jgi:hypothetical protein